MAESTGRRVLERLFGTEGTIATDAGLQVVVVSTSLAVMGVYAMSPILSSLTGPMAVSPARIGAVITAFTAPSIAIVPVVGLLADRLGRRRLLVLGLVLFGLGGGAIALTADFTTVLALRAVQGVGFAAINPLGVTVIGDLFRGPREMTAQGLRVAGIQTSSLLVPPLAGALVIVAWQAPFLVYTLALPAAVWAWVALPASTPRGSASSVRQYVAELLALLRRPTLAAIQLSFVVRFGLSFGFYAYVSVLLADQLGSSALDAGLAVAFIAVTAILGSTQVGRLSARHDDVVVLLAALPTVGLGVVLMAVWPSYLTVALGAAILGLGFGVSGPVQKSLVTQLSPDGLRAGAVSSALLFQSVGQVVGPLLLGLLVATLGAGAAFVTFGAAGSVAGVALVAVAYRSSRAAG